MEKSFEVKFLKKAKTEMLQSFDWYEEQSIGLGDRFLNELFTGVESIKKHPESFPEKIADYRELTLQVFPFILIYKISKSKNKIAIVSVFHAKRNPKRKYK
jgi:plasmid stabilization system protein ParE